MGMQNCALIAFLFALICSLGALHVMAANQKSSTGESDFWSFIRRHMAGPLYWLHLKLESVKAVPDVGSQMRSLYQYMFQIKSKTELTFVPNHDFVMNAMLISFLSFIVLILLNFTSCVISIVFTIFILITYRIQGAVWCFDNIMLLLSLISLAPTYIMQNPTAVLPYMSTILGLFLAYRMLSRFLWGGRGTYQPVQEARNGYEAGTGDQSVAALEHRMAMMESQQHTIIAKLDALANKVDANSPR